MVPTRVLAALCLLTSTLLLVPAASADPQACVGKPCPQGYVLVVDAAGQHVDACVIAVNGGCQPYQGHLVRVHVNDQESSVPDPCYTTACW